MPDTGPQGKIFRTLWDNGFHGLVPILPVDAPISAQSKLDPRYRGKAVAQRGRDGQWSGFDFLKHEPTEKDIDRWQQSGAGVGIKTGPVVGIDCDCLDKDLSMLIRDVTRKTLGKTAMRLGRAPKWLMPYRAAKSDTPIKWRRIRFEMPGNDKIHHVEVLATKSQFVAFGIHSYTKQPYRWDRPAAELTMDSLPAINEAAVQRWEDAVRAALVDYGAKISAADSGNASPSIADRERIDQSRLAGHVDRITQTVKNLPNAYDDRDDYIKVLTSIKAALPDAEDAAFELAQEWALKWEGNANGSNTPEVVAADWSRIHPPYSIGVGWLSDEARKHGYLDAHLDFGDVPLPGAKELEAVKAQNPQKIAAPFVWLPVSAWPGMEVPERKWIVRNWIPYRRTTLLYGMPGLGKSLLALQLAYSASTGTPFLGIDIPEPVRTIGVFCEDDADELQIRSNDIATHADYMLDLSCREIRENCKITARVDDDNFLAMFDRADQMILTPEWHRLYQEIADSKTQLCILDTLSDVFGGDEIRKLHANLFIKRALGIISKKTDCTFIVLAHPSKAGAREGTSGSVGWEGAVRSRLHLDRIGEGRSDYRKLTQKKANYGASGSEFRLRYDRGCLTVEAAVGGDAPDQFTNVEEMAERLFLECLDEMNNDGACLSGKKRSGEKWAPRAMMRDSPEKFEGLTDTDLEAAMARLVAAGELDLEAGRGPGRDRKPRFGVGRAGFD